MIESFKLSINHRQRLNQVSNRFLDGHSCFNHVHLISRHLPISNDKILQIQKKTVKDSQLRIQSKTIYRGWPKCRKMGQAEARLFWNIQHELSTIRGIIFKGERLVIPKALQPDMLKQLFATHLGIEKTKQRAQMLVYWPSMNTDRALRPELPKLIQKHVIKPERAYDQS